MTTFDRFITVFWRSIDSLMAALLACMVLLVFSNVVLRYGFSTGIRPSVELSRLGFVWIVMLGAAVTLRHREHLSITDVSEALFPRLVPFFRIVSAVVLMLHLNLFSADILAQALVHGVDSFPLLAIPFFLIAGEVMASSGGPATECVWPVPTLLLIQWHVHLGAPSDNSTAMANPNAAIALSEALR